MAGFVCAGSSSKALLQRICAMSNSSSSSSSSASGSDAPQAQTPAVAAQPHDCQSVMSAAEHHPICFATRKARKCCLCGCCSVDESPLEYPDDIFPEHQGRLPWRSYEKVKNSDGDTVRVPSGKLCLICFNVYRALGSSKQLNSLSFSGVVPGLFLAFSLVLQS